MSTNSRSVAGFGEMQNEVVEISQQNLKGQSSANITEIPNNLSQFRSTNQLMNNLTITSKIMKKPYASGNVINTIINEQNVDSLEICSTCKSALDKNNIPHLSVYNGFYYPKHHSIYQK